MATTTNLGITLLEIGQKNKETTINDALTLIDTKVQGKNNWLGVGTTDPTPSAALIGSTFYRTDTAKMRVLINATTWVNAA